MKNTSSIFYNAALGKLILIGFPMLVAFVLTFVIGLAKYADPGSLTFFVGVALMIGGWITLVYSKWDQVRSGRLLAWGVTDPKKRVLYFLSYLFMVAGYLLSTFSGALWGGVV